MMTSIPVILQKNYSRGSYLAEAMVWRDGECKNVADWLGFGAKDALFLRPNGRDLLEVWYSEDEIRRFKETIAKKVVHESGWFDRVVRTSSALWEQLLPAMKEEKALTPLELKEFHERFIEYWPPMGIIDVIPDIPTLSEDVRAKALALREDRQRNSHITDEPYARTIREYYPALKNYIYVLTPEEIFTGSFPDISKLEMRKKGWFLTDDSFELVGDLRRTLDLRNWMLEKTDTNVSEVSGMAAFPGKVTGTAKVIGADKNIGKLQEGDILIATMTSPSFMPYLHKAAAFVTDEGGITCHAAIVAREMKKPCVIGTKIGTQVFKDGDMVEVDAEKGVVRIVTHYA